MRTHERTYLQTIGAQDPDKNDELHNKMCIFLADKTSFPRIAEIMGINDGVDFSAHLNEPINKYINNTANLFGFADLIIRYKVPSKVLGLPEPVLQYRQILIEVKSKETNILNCIQQIKSYLSVWPEVLYGDDALPREMATVIRKFKTISHDQTLTAHVPRFASSLLVTAYRISKNEKKLLFHNGILHVFLDNYKVEKFFKNNELDVENSF